MSGSRSPITRSDSSATVERSCAITAPLLIGGAGLSGMTRDTYCSPNSVLGRIWADTLLGICDVRLGFSSRVIDAPSPSDFTFFTVPTMMPRSLTSDWVSNWLPVWSAFSVTEMVGVNALL
jgi:hypothetical protein